MVGAVALDQDRGQESLRRHEKERELQVQHHFDRLGCAGLREAADLRAPAPGGARHFQ